MHQKKFPSFWFLLPDDLQAKILSWPQGNLLQYKQQKKHGWQWQISYQSVHTVTHSSAAYMHRKTRNLTDNISNIISHLFTYRTGSSVLCSSLLFTMCALRGAAIIVWHQTTASSWSWGKWISAEFTRRNSWLWEVRKLRVAAFTLHKITNWCLYTLILDGFYKLDIICFVVHFRGSGWWIFLYLWTKPVWLFPTASCPYAKLSSCELCPYTYWTDRRVLSIFLSNSWQ